MASDGKADLVNFLATQSTDYHCHGVGRFDFTEIAALDLQEVEDILAVREHKTILTLYLPKPNFNDFLNLVERFDAGKQAGKFLHIEGLALEGPLLGSHGGTPESGVWMPTHYHWEQLAECGKKGLVYVILSPDAHFPGSNFVFDKNSPSVEWITHTLLTGGVLPAPGHFVKTNPIESAKALQSIFYRVEKWGHGPTITDHLYNDMPHNFKHAWRTPEEKAKRDIDIKRLQLESWSLDTLEETLGPVPATMIRNARNGLVKICQNFDGEHVDLAIVKRTVELAGVNNILMMTDSIESKRLAGRRLHLHEGSTLLYQDEGIVAAGSQDVHRQIENMLSIGMTTQAITSVISKNPEKLFKRRQKYFKKVFHDQVNCV